MAAGSFGALVAGQGRGVDRPELRRNGDRLACAEIARSRRSRRRGLLGRDGIDGVLVLPGTRQVHTVGMRFAIDVAWCDEQGTVVRVATLAPNRLGAWVRTARTVLEGEAGRFDEWGLHVDDRLAWDEAPRNLLQLAPHGEANCNKFWDRGSGNRE
jgi:uncharacterized membrane protein (UPF0127 family)